MTRLLGFVLVFSQVVKAQPVAILAAERYNICSGTSVQFFNYSTGANDFEWKINDVHYSYSFDTSAVLVDPCYSMQSIRLIASDTVTGASDSSDIYLEVFDTCYFHWTGDFIQCIGDTVKVDINPEEINTQFVITPPHSLLSGCLTCPSIEFVLTANGVTVDRTSTYFGGCSELTTYHYLCGLSVDEQNQKAVHIYPNPVTDLLYISSPELFTVTVLKSTGQLIYNNHGHSVISFSELQQGIYILKVAFKDGSRSIKKVVRQ